MQNARRPRSSLPQFSCRFALARYTKKLWAIWCCIWLLSSVCWAQGERFSPQANSIREEDLPADPKPGLRQPPAFPAQQERGQPFARERFYSQPFPPPSWDTGSPPTLPNPPALPMLNEKPQVEQGRLIPPFCLLRILSPCISSKKEKAY